MDRMARAWENGRNGGRQGDIVTTTGGPGHDLDRVTLDHDAPLDGDDIVVEPHAPEHQRKHHREIVVGIVVGLLAIGAVAVALAARDSGGKTEVSAESPARTPAGHPTDDEAARNAAGTTVVKPGATTKNTSGALIPPVAITKPATIVDPTPTAPAAPPPDAGSSPGYAGTGDTVAPTTPTPTLPPTSPPSVLQWSTDPAAVAIKAGAHAFVTVTVTNPSAGNVTLPHPLSCPPELQPAHGAPIGGLVCAEMAQIMAPHSHVVAHYTLYATDTGDASGAPLPAGQYTANIEGLHTVKVTIAS
jgi:hypothetical protein